MGRSAVLFALLLSLAGATRGQFTPGHAVVASSDGLRPQMLMLGVSPGGVVTTLHQFPFAARGIVQSVNNVDILMSVQPNGDLITMDPLGRLNTLVTAAGSVAESFDMDQDGTYLFPAMIGTQHHLVIVRVGQHGMVTTLLPSPPIATGSISIPPSAIAVDSHRGDYLLAYLGLLYRVSHLGVMTSIPLPTMRYSAEICSDMRTGDLLYGGVSALMRIDPVHGTASTFTTLPPLSTFSIAYDRASDTWLACNSPFSQEDVYRIDRSGRVQQIASIVTGNLFFARGFEVYGSNHVIAVSDPTPGSVFSLALSEPGSAGCAYVAAAALSPGPGIPTPAGIVDLTPDPLFHLSQNHPAMFQHFHGVLNMSGRGSAAIVIPGVPSLQGLRFYISFVTIGPGGIQSIANTRGFTIR